MIKLFNYTWIGISSFFILLVSRFLFLGSEEDFDFLKTDLVINVLKRAVSVASIGLISMFLLVLINYLKTKDLNKSLKIGIYGLFICAFFSLLGTLLFFNN